MEKDWRIKMSEETVEFSYRRKGEKKTIKFKSKDMSPEDILKKLKEFKEGK